MYGSYFHFKVFREDKTTSNLGGTMTILTTLLLGLFTYLFGHNFFYRINPKVTQSNILPDDYSKFSLTEEKIKIPWRIEDVSAIPVDPTGILYPKIYYYSSERNPDTLEFEEYQTEYLNYYLCNSTNVESNENDLPLGSYYCIDFENRPLGGYWDGNFIYYLEIQIFFCPDGKPVDDNNNCTDIEKLQEYLNSENLLYFSIYYPTHQFQPKSYDSPIKIHYSTHYTPINPITRKNDRLFFKEIQLIDDKGIIFETKKHYHHWIADKLEQEYKHHPEEKLYEKGHTSKLYTMNIYVSIDKTIYTRVYEKLYNVMAVVGGFSQIVIMIFRLICEYFNMIKARTTLLNSSFYFEKHDENKKSFFSNQNPLKVTKSHKEHNFQFSNSSELSIQQPHLSNIMTYTHKAFATNNKDKQNVKNNQFNQSNSFSNKNNNLYHIETGNYLRYKFHKIKCLRKLLMKKNIVTNNYFILAYKYIDKLIDIRNYLMLNKEILILKYYFLDNEQLFALSNLRKYYWYKDVDKKILRIGIGQHLNDKHESLGKNISKHGSNLSKFLMRFIDVNKCQEEFMKDKTEINIKSNQSTNIIDNNVNNNFQFSFLFNNKQKDQQRRNYITDLRRHNTIMDNFLQDKSINKNIIFK